MNAAVRPHRLFVSGGSELSANSAALWRELGRCLADKDGIVVITGGLEGRTDSPGGKTADRMVIDGCVERLAERGIDPHERIETFLPAPRLDWDQVKRFEKGRVYELTNRTAQSRRFRMVFASDVVISIEGEIGARSVLDVALAIERPFLPMPFAGGTSASVWEEEREEIRRAFQLTPDEVKEFENVKLADLDNAGLSSLAARIVECVSRGFTGKCFVMMPFHNDFNPVYEKAIVPALEANGITPIRTDRHIVNGNIVEAIRDGLKYCHFAIADTTADRPNVMYELGMAHAHNKPVILLRRNASPGDLALAPFDVRTESLLKYDDDLNDLRGRLEAAVSVITGKKALHAAAE